MNLFFIFGAKYLVMVPVIILAVYFLFQPRTTQKNMILFALPALVLTYLLSKITGHFYFNPRPFVVEHITPLIPHVADNGFPSDHTLFVAALAAITSFWNRKLAVILWIIVLIIAVSRVYANVHHPIDVIGSIIIALLGTFIMYALYAYVWHKKII